MATGWSKEKQAWSGEREVAATMQREREGERERGSVRRREATHTQLQVAGTLPRPCFIQIAGGRPSPALRMAPSVRHIVKYMQAARRWHLTLRRDLHWRRVPCVVSVADVAFQRSL